MGPLLKPNAKRAKAAKKRAEAKQHRALIARVRDRDGAFCRACGIHDLHGDPHHIRYRSLGGKDSASNLAWLCRTCHRLTHDKRLRITGTADDLRIDR